MVDQNKTLSDLLDSDDFEKIASYALNLDHVDLDTFGRRKLISYCLKRGLDRQFLEMQVSYILRQDNYKLAEPFIEYVHPDILLIRSVEVEWADGINYAIKAGAKNFEQAVYKAVQKNNTNLAQFLKNKIRSV